MASATQTTFDGGYVRNNLRYTNSQDPQALISSNNNSARVQRCFRSLIGCEKYHGVRPAKDLRESVDVLLMRSYFQCCSNISITSELSDSNGRPHANGRLEPPAPLISCIVSDN